MQINLTISNTNADVDSHCVSNDLNFDVVYGENVDDAISNALKNLRKNHNMKSLVLEDNSIDNHGRTLLQYSYKIKTTGNIYERNAKKTWSPC